MRGAPRPLLIGVNKNTLSPRLVLPENQLCTRCIIGRIQNIDSMM
jgi:hypothetical protein